MSHNISEYGHYVATDSIVWGFSIEEGGSAKSLSGATVNYYVLSNRGDADGDAIIDDGSADVTVDVEPSTTEHPDAPSSTTGYIEVRIDSGNLDRPGETLWHRLVIDDGSGGQKTFRGVLPVQVE